jgi:hypothetical protein
MPPVRIGFYADYLRRIEPPALVEPDGSEIAVVAGVVHKVMLGLERLLLALLPGLGGLWVANIGLFMARMHKIAAIPHRTSW